MPSDKLRRDFAPEPEILESLDEIPLMKRSRVVNEALRQYFDKEKELDFKTEVLASLKKITNLLEQLVKKK